MDQFFTWDFIATFAGAGVFTAAVTGFLKKYVPIPTQLLAYFVALAGLLLGHLFTGDFSPATAFLCLFNAIPVAAATSGTYDSILRMSSKNGLRTAQNTDSTDAQAFGEKAAEPVAAGGEEPKQ